MWHLFWQDVAESNCMDMGKGTDHVVNLHVYTGASLEQVLPSRNCHQEILSGSVPPYHHLSSAMLGKQQASTSSSGEWVSILESSEDSLCSS